MQRHEIAGAVTIRKITFFIITGVLFLLLSAQALAVEDNTTLFRQGHNYTQSTSIPGQTGATGLNITIGADRIYIRNVTIPAGSGATKIYIYNGTSLGSKVLISSCSVVSGKCDINTILDPNTKIIIAADKEGSAYTDYYAGSISPRQDRFLRFSTGVYYSSGWANDAADFYGIKEFDVQNLSYVVEPPAPPPSSDLVNVTFTAVNAFDDSSVNSFNLSYADGINPATIVTTHNGSIRLELNSTSLWYFYSYWSHSFLNRESFTLPVNISLNTSLVARFISAAIRFTAYDNFTDQQIYTFCVNQKPAYAPVCTTNGVAELTFKAGGSLGINATADTYFSIVLSPSKTVTPSNATNTTDSVELYKRLNITAQSATGTEIATFNYCLTGLNYSHYLCAIGSTFTQYVGNQSYNLTINVTGYAQYNNSLVKDTKTQNTTHFRFILFTTNAFDIEFLDEKTLQRIDNINISLDLISDTFSSNYSTKNGTIYVDALTPETYSFRYLAAGYAPRISTFVLTNNTYTQVKLYMLTTGDNITLNVVDTLNNPVENAQIHIYRYSVVSNSYILVNTINTDFQGIAVTNLEKNAEFYKFYIYYNNVLKLSTSPAYITGDSIAFTINLDSPILDQYFKFGSNYTTSLVYNQDTQNFRFYYDTNGEASQGCLKLHYLTTQGETLFNSSCSASSAATILVTAANVSDRSYIARSYITIAGKEYLVQTATYQFKGIVIDSKTGLFFTFVLFFILFALATATNVSPLVISPLAFVISSALNLTNIDIGAAIGLEVLGIILAVMIGKRGD